MNRNIGSVLVLSKGFPPTNGGVESYSKSIADEYQRLGVSVKVLTAKKSKTAFLSTPYEVETVVSGYQIVNFFQFIAMLLTFRFRRERYDFIHATTWRVALPAVLVFPHTTCFVTAHGNEILVKGILQRIMKWTLGRVFLILCVSDYTKNLVLQRCSGLNSKLLSVHNGLTVDCSNDDFHNKWVSRPDYIKVFSVCRHEKRKNLISAVYAFKYVVEGAEYKIAGDGPQTAQLSSVICDPNERIDRVKMLGRVSDIQLRELYAESHIFLHPQKEDVLGGDVEGFGLVVADAMAMECVPIAGNNGGTKELISDGFNGILLDDCDPSEIARCLNELIQNYTRAREMAVAARQYAVSNFSWRKHVQEILESIEAAI